MSGQTLRKNYSSANCMLPFHFKVLLTEVSTAFLGVLGFRSKAMNRNHHLPDCILQVCSQASSTNNPGYSEGSMTLIVYMETNVNSGKFVKHLKDIF